MKNTTFDVYRNCVRFLFLAQRWGITSTPASLMGRTCGGIPVTTARILGALGCSSKSPSANRDPQRLRWKSSHGVSSNDMCSHDVSPHNMCSHNMCSYDMRSHDMCLGNVGRVFFSHQAIIRLTKRWFSKVSGYRPHTVCSWFSSPINDTSCTCASVSAFKGHARTSTSPVKKTRPLRRMSA